MTKSCKWKGMLNSSDESSGKGCTPHEVAEYYDGFWFGQVGWCWLLVIIL